MHASRRKDAVFAHLLRRVFAKVEVETRDVPHMPRDVAPRPAHHRCGIQGGHAFAIQIAGDPTATDAPGLVKLSTSVHTMAPFLLQFDGGARASTKASGAGAVLYDPFGVELDQRSILLAPCTNNTAEYEALIAGLDMARAWKVRELAVQGDSKLVIEQVMGKFRVNFPHLRALKARVLELMEDFDSISFEHIPRAKNARADALANEAMDKISL